MIRSFEDLECYQKARDLRRKLSSVVSGFPQEETFRLKDQVIRASRSVTANIAEGYGRHHHQENLQFCRQARGSLTEILDHLGVAVDEKYVSAEKHRELVAEIEVALRLLNGYIGYLQKCAKSGVPSRAT